MDNGGLFYQSWDINLNLADPFCSNGRRIFQFSPFKKILKLFKDTFLYEFNGGKDMLQEYVPEIFSIASYNLKGE